MTKIDWRKIRDARKAAADLLDSIDYSERGLLTMNFGLQGFSDLHQRLQILAARALSIRVLSRKAVQEKCNLLSCELDVLMVDGKFPAPLPSVVEGAEPMWSEMEIVCWMLETA